MIGWPNVSAACPELAVRSSATAEDLPEASFAGAAETFLNVRGRDGLLRAVHQCYSSLFTDRAISYRARLGYDQLKVALSVGVMPMVRSDKASSGVIFTLDSESGFRDAVFVSAPTDWASSSFKASSRRTNGPSSNRRWQHGPSPNHRPPARIKEVRLVYADGSRSTRSEATPAGARAQFCLTDDEVLTLARWACSIEAHYSTRPTRRSHGHRVGQGRQPGELFIVQARPETVHSSKPRIGAPSVST